MKKLYTLILLSLISCSEKIKEKEAAVEVPTQDTIPSAVKVEYATGNSVGYITEDISGEYELIDGKTYIIDDENYESYKAALVIERLSETDFGFYSTDKTKDISPIGDFGVFGKFQENFYKLDICDGESIEGYTKDNFTTGLYLHNQMIFHQKGDSLGIIQYGSNFRKYMLYRKRKSNMHTSLVQTMKNTKLEYQDFLSAYEKAKNHDTAKLQIEQHYNGTVWETKHRHQEDYTSFQKSYSYQDPYQDGKFIEHDEIFKNKFLNSNFNEVIRTMHKRSLPMKEATNFDDFHEVDDVKKVNAEVLQLLKIYPDYFKEDSSIKAIRTYRIELSKRFYTVVVTLLKGENEMESVLINYNTDGTFIDSKVISYDEIAEGQSQIESKIKENTVTIDNIFWGNEKQTTTQVFKIRDNGKIESTALEGSGEASLIDKVITKLNLDKSQIKSDLVVSKVRPNNDDETIVVIPEIVSEEEQYFELNSYIVLVNNKTGKITHQYFESAQTNHWVSDAMQLKELKIDSTPYIIAKKEMVFGVRVNYYGASHANPYSNETISLFVKSGNTLKKVLNNYDVMDYGGEWDTNCSGEFVGSKATLAMSAEKTNGYFDVRVENTITETKNYEDENGDCESKNEITIEKKVLKFDGKEYKPQDVF